MEGEVRERQRIKNERQKQRKRNPNEDIRLHILKQYTESFEKKEIRRKFTHYIKTENLF